MITDQQRDAVMEAVIKPMTALYAPRYGASESSIEAATSQYVEDLAGFPRHILEAGYRSVRQSYKGKNWPVPEELIRACHEAKHIAERAAKSTSGEHWRRDFWPEVGKRKAAFLEMFGQGTLAAQAKAEGWWSQLEGYARECANYQAQIVVRLERQGRPISADRYPAEHKDYFCLYDMERDSGIAISVTHTMVETFKARLDSQRRSHDKFSGKTPSFGVPLHRAAEKATEAIPDEPLDDAAAPAAPPPVETQQSAEVSP